MIKKSHAFALAVTTVGLIGFAAPMAGAATMQGQGNPVVNVANNQVPVQACGNNLNLNGGGIQVPTEGNALVGSLLSPYSATSATSTENRGCVMANSQTTVTKGGAGGAGAGAGGAGGSSGSLVNVTNNQIPIQACGNDVNGNLLGAQGTAEGTAGALALLSPAAITTSTSTENRGCALENSQDTWGW